MRRDLVSGVHNPGCTMPPQTGLREWRAFEDIAMPLDLSFR
jgi:hypothetical protein